jgi:NitT/TauT family transport system ATP-binding protein
MKQRVAIARALANQPRILLMDEPFGALDAQTRCSMQAHLLKIWENVDVTVVFITHDLDEAIYLADRIVVLGANPGRILEVIDVPVPRPRHSGQFLSGHFLATKKRLESLIYSAQAPDHDRAAGSDDAAFVTPA